MPRKNKRKQTQRPTSGEQTVPAELTPEQQAEADARREQQKREWQERKKAKERKKTPTAVYAWAGGIVAAIAGVAVVIFLLVQGGGDDSNASAITPTPDSRVAGLPVDQTVEVEAGDAGQATGTFFEPNEVSGQAGQVIEIKVVNIGSVAHNLRVSGSDGEYDTRDDFLSEPGTIQPGEEGTVKVKIDEPGLYPFRCDFHAQQQIGNLVITG